MNTSNFSLDYLAPTLSAASVAAAPGLTPAPALAPAAAPAADPWDEAVHFYGAPVLTTLQEDGRKRVRELFDITKVKTKTPDLGLDEFTRVIHEMVRRRQVAVVEDATAFADCIIALPIRS